MKTNQTTVYVQVVEEIDRWEVAPFNPRSEHLTNAQRKAWYAIAGGERTCIIPPQMSDKSFLYHLARESAYPTKLIIDPNHKFQYKFIVRWKE